MQRRHLLGGLAAGFAAAGCDTPARLASLPDGLRNKATFNGLPADCRIVLDGTDDRLLGKIAGEALHREIADADRNGIKKLGDADLLAISGGGENGAFGAGLLTAWSEDGTRPVFKAVTGVSTGALIAPFAFLGSSYDKDLERFYTQIKQADVMASRGLVSGLLGESFYDSTPLLRLIRGVMTPEMVAAIAHEYTEKGRLLFVATTNLDVPVGVLWNIGGIAASGNPKAGELIARILLASASIPGAFPPVMIDIEAGGEHFQEMHVDGATVAQVVLYPPSFSADDLLADDTPTNRRAIEARLDRKWRLYVIRNSRPGADIKAVERSTMKIASRALATLISSQGIGDLYQLYVLCRRDGIDYNVAYIPASFTTPLPAPFDTAYMNDLYKVGRQEMQSGRAWHKYPPGYSPTKFAQPHATE
jgi:hypothetical protein